MKSDTNQTLKNLTVEELKNKLVELEAQLFKLKFQHSIGQLDKTGLLKSVRKDIARVKTYQTQKASLNVHMSNER